MKNMKDNVDFSNLYPIREINDECIVNKCGDMTLAYELTLPSRNSLPAEGYNQLRDIFVRAYAMLARNTIILKQDIYFTDVYNSVRTDKSFLLKSYYSHFNGRQYLSHRSLLFFTLPHRNRTNISSLQGILFRKNILSGQENEALALQFAESVRQCVSVISSDSNIKIRNLTAQEAHTLIDRYMSFQRAADIINHDYRLTPENIIIGDRQIYNLSISALNDLPLALDENIRESELSTDSSTLYTSPLACAGYNIPGNHVVNQYIKIIDSDKELSKLSQRSRFLRSFSTLSAQNELNYQHITDYIAECAETKALTVKTSVQILTEKKESINALITAFARNGIRLRSNTYNAPEVFWSGIPGNAANLAKEEYCTMPLHDAVALTSLESADTGIASGSFDMAERTTHIPVSLDFGQVAMDAGLITNFNIFTLGPSGSGKSFLTNEYLTQSYFKDHAHCIVIDQGNSYFPLCQIIKEESDGKDGIYFNAADYPFSFNPFLSADTEEDRTFLLSLLMTIWKKEHSTAAEDSLLNEAIALYLDKEKSGRSLDGFRNYLNTEWKKEYAKEIAETGFAISDLLTALRQFCGKGKYAALLNNKENVDLSTKRFVLFEIDNVSSDKVLFPIVTLLITKLFADKMRHVPERKIMLIEEAWRAIASPQMEGWIQWLWKTARKHNAQAMVVTQEVEDIISSPVVKQAIVNNSAIKILLDQKNLKDKYDDIASILSLSVQDKNLIFSINRNNDNRYRYREAYIAIGSKRGIYCLETSPQAYWAYTTTKGEQVRLAHEAGRTGSYITAIESLTKNNLKS